MMLLFLILALIFASDYLEPEEHVTESAPSLTGPAPNAPTEGYLEIAPNAIDNPEYFDGPVIGKPLPPDPRTNNNNNNPMDKLSQGAGEKTTAPRLQKLNPTGAPDSQDSYINTDYDHLGNREQKPLVFLNPRNETTI